ncbi:MAG TPA: hypothetical protein VF169_03955 [Albitalea sp.]|uniref:hypothetical protein n=1 Tax=Piscinibacter sp. TaxID=1903157 RepID=UPI002ED390E1
MKMLQLSAHGAIVITNCSARKRQFGPSVSYPEGAHSTLDEMARSWISATKASEQASEARHLYVGRAFSDARITAQAIQGALFIASAGFGLIAAEQQLPHYCLTVSGGAGSIRHNLRAIGASSSDWWQAIKKVLGQPSLAHLVMRPEVDSVLLSMPSSYLAMVRQDLADLPHRYVDKLRVFTSSAGMNEVPEQLRSAVLPYDDRLERVAAYAGTRADFPQRAMRHFVEALGAHRMSLAKGVFAVEQALAGMERPNVPARAKAADAEIAALLRAQWTKHGGSSSRLLRFLRDDAMVACEQGRFRGIWWSVKSEMAA